MTEVTEASLSAGGHTRSAVGRLTVLVEMEDGTEKITYERRWSDLAAAREWCEQKVRGVSAGTAVLEIQVTGEVWGQRHAWEATASRHIPETLQLGLRTSTDTVIWGATHDVGSEPGARRRA
jgi:hypothetical protein